MISIGLYWGSSLVSNQITLHMQLLKYALELLDFACETLQNIFWLLQPLLQEPKGHQLPHNLSNVPGIPVFLGRPDYPKSSQPQILGLHLELQVEGGEVNIVHR